MSSVPSGFLVLVAAAVATYLFARLFEDEAARAYSVGRTARGVLWIGFAGLTVIVLVSTGHPVLILSSVFLVVFIVLWLLFDYYSPVSDI